MIKLPPLPTPYSNIYPEDPEDCCHYVCYTPSAQPGGGRPNHQPVFTADQMRAYAEAALASGARMLRYIEAQYAALADIRNEWPGRNTVDGQRMLCTLRDLICEATGRDTQDVQDDYSTRLQRAGLGPVVMK